MGYLSAALAVLSAARKLGPLVKDLWPLLTAAAAVIANHLAGGPLTPAESAGAVVAGGAVAYHLGVVKRLKTRLGSILRPNRV